MKIHANRQVHKYYEQRCANVVKHIVKRLWNSNEVENFVKTK